MKKIFYISFVALLLLCDSAFAVKKEIVYVRGTGNYNDSAVIAAIAGWNEVPGKKFQTAFSKGFTPAQALGLNLFCHSFCISAV